MANSMSVARIRPRCHPGSDVWHFRADCSDWPDTVYGAEDQLPASAMTCGECIELAGALDAA